LIAFSPHSVVVGLAPGRALIGFGTAYEWLARICSTSGRAASASTSAVPADSTKIALTI
jgi:hypothetical protein